MKIVIDIPDGCYEELNNGQFPIQDAYRIVTWIKDGTLLEDIKSRIKERADEEDIVNFAKGMLFALEMIDSEVEE